MPKDQPMSPDAPENPVGIASTNRQRVCYAAQTLIDEVNSAYDGAITYTTSNPTRFNVLLDVSFDCSDEPTLVWLLAELHTDRRIKSVTADEGQVIVEFRENFRLQDLRDPFGLTDAALLLDEEDPS